MSLKFKAMPTAQVRAYQAGDPDANGLRPEIAVSDGGGNPCRHCLTDIPAGQEMLVLAHRPFAELQPYAEVGPIFLCADSCERHPDAATMPDLFHKREKLLIKGYTADNRIFYGTGQIVGVQEVEQQAAEIFSNPAVTYIHMRSASNNCYQARIERG